MLLVGKQWQNSLGYLKKRAFFTLISAWLVASNTSVHMHFLCRLKQFTIFLQENSSYAEPLVLAGVGGSATAATDGRDKGTEKQQDK
jgi:hypothetical protein